MVLEQNLDLIDAIYFTVTIMTTTGFGDIHLRNAPPALQLYGVALMLSGTAALAILFALITDAPHQRPAGPRPGRHHPRRPARPRGRVYWATSATGWSSSSTTWACRWSRPSCTRATATCRRCAAWVSRCWWATSASPRRWRRCTSAGRARWWWSPSDIVNLETALNTQTLTPNVRVVLRLFDPDLADRVERALGIHISAALGAGRPGLRRRRGRRARPGHGRGREQVLAVARLRVAPGCQAEDRTVGELQSAAGSRVLLLSDAQGPAGARSPPGPASAAPNWSRSSPAASRVLAWTGTGAHAGRHQRP